MGFTISFQVNFPPGPVLFWTFLFFCLVYQSRRTEGTKRMVETTKFNIIFLPSGLPFFLMLFVFLLLILIHRARSGYNDDG
jgi:hypothetical protein